MLTLLSLSMFFGSYLSGIIPTVLNFSETKIRQLSILGAGILVGTSLSVIIPEGVNSLYSSALCMYQIYLNYYYYCILFSNLSFLLLTFYKKK